MGQAITYPNSASRRLLGTSRHPVLPLSANPLSRYGLEHWIIQPTTHQFAAVPLSGYAPSGLYRPTILNRTTQFNVFITRRSKHMEAEQLQQRIHASMCRLSEAVQHGFAASTCARASQLGSAPPLGSD